MRFALMLFVASCDGVLHLEPVEYHGDAGPDAALDAPPDAPPGPCDVFSTVDQVQFTQFTPASDFSVERTGHYAIAIGDPGVGGNAPHMLYRADAGAPFGVAGSGLDTLPPGLQSPRIATKTDMFGSRRPAGTSLFVQIYEDAYGGTWQELPGPIDTAGADEYVTGYAMEPDLLPRVVVVQHRNNMPNVLLMRRHQSNTWLPEPQNNVSTSANVSAGAVTDDGLTLVYAADQLYVTHRGNVGAEFPAGKPVMLPGGTVGDLEPWPNADCSELYFRRDATIYVAR